MTSSTLESPEVDLTTDSLRPHRPRGRVVMRPIWRHLLFLHWPVPAAQLQTCLPPGLEVDVFDGQAYVGLVPFTMLRVVPRGLPPIRGCSDFHEINVRTYVRCGGREPGVWFFSLDAANLPAVCAARQWYKLPYFFARMSLEWHGGEVAYNSERLWSGPLPARCTVRYRPTGVAAPAPPDTLEHFLVERYRLYSYAGGHLYSGRVYHKPYRLQPAAVSALDQNLVGAAGIDLDGAQNAPPLVHYAYEVRTEVFAPHRVD